MTAKLFPTSLVGSYPQPEWLIDRAKLAGRFPPRVRAKELWRVAPEFLDQAQDDATLIAIRDQERAVPRVVGRIQRRHAVETRDVAFLRANTDRKIKITVPGPFTMAQQAQNDFYKDEAEMAHDYAVAVNAEIKDLFAAGADYVQVDEPYMQARPEKARAYGLAALDRALEGVEGQTAVHICFGYAAIIHARPTGYSFLPELCKCRVRQISIETAQSNLDTSVLKNFSDQTIILGVIDLASHKVETPEIVAERIRRALPHIDPARIILAPDCGMKYLPRDVAFGKMRAMVEGAAIVRREVTGEA